MRVVLGTDGLQVSMLLGSVWVPVLGPVAIPALAAAGPVQVGFAAVSGPGAPVGGGQHDIGDVVITTPAPPAPPVTVPKPKVPVTVADDDHGPTTTTTTGRTDDHGRADDHASRRRRHGRATGGPRPATPSGSIPRNRNLPPAVVIRVGVARVSGGSGRSGRPA